MPKFLANLDLNQNELQNAVVQVLSANPSSPTTGQIYYNSSSNVLRYYDGTAWEDLAAGSGGETNQNAFSIVAVSGQSNVEADAKTDTLNLAAGSNVTITTNATSDTVTISATGNVTSVNSQTGVVVLDADDISDAATTNKFATSGQLAKVDFLTITQAVDLDTLESNVATNNAKVSNVTTNLGVTANGTSLTVTSSDGTDASIPAATTSAWGAMTDEDKTKLDGIEASADVTDSANVTTALGSISVAAHSDVTSAGSGAIITTAERSKLSGIEANADVTDTTNVKAALNANLGSYSIGDSDDTGTFGNITVQGNLTVSGSTTSIDTTNLNVTDALIELNSGLTTANSNDAGIIIERGTSGNNAAFIWDESTAKFIVGTTTATGASTGALTVTAGTIQASTFDGDLTGDVTGNVSGSAGSADTLTTARNIALGGDLSGSANFDGSANITITATVADDSHNHVISNVDGLQTALDAKAPLASPALTGTPTAPSASAATDTTQIATTAFTQDAIDARSYAVNIGDGTNTSYTITHNLGTRDVIIQLYDASSYDTIFADVVRTNTTQATISFSSAPTTNDVRVLVTKVV